MLGRSPKITKKKFVLVSPTVNSGEKERLQLRNFVLTECPEMLFSGPMWPRGGSVKIYLYIFLFSDDV